MKKRNNKWRATCSRRQTLTPLTTDLKRLSVVEGVCVCVCVCACVQETRIDNKKGAGAAVTSLSV